MTTNLAKYMTQIVLTSNIYNIFANCTKEKMKEFSQGSLHRMFTVRMLFVRTSSMVLLEYSHTNITLVFHKGEYSSSLFDERKTVTFTKNNISHLAYSKDKSLNTLKKKFPSISLSNQIRSLLLMPTSSQ